MATLLVPLSAARAQDLNRTDRVSALYSNKFSFDRRGVPAVTVRIHEGLTQVTVEGAAPPTVLPDGDGGSEVTAGKRWRVKLVSGKAGQADHFAVVARLPATQVAPLQRALALWNKRKVAVQPLEVGAVFGIKGQVFDNRVYLLVDGPYKDGAAADAVAHRHQAAFSLDRASTVAQLRRRPTAALRVESLDSSTRIAVRDVVWFFPAAGSTLTVDTGSGTPRSYWGRVYVTADRNGKLAVVNAVPADRMLEGLVPAEIFPSAPEHALRAQAVATRGELLAKIGTRHLEDPYLLCASVHCQVYKGAGSEHPRTTKAVRATRGAVLMRKDGSLVDTVYSAVCGGHTEHNDNVWPSPPDDNLRGHLDALGNAAALKPYANGITANNLDAWLDSRPPTWCGSTQFNKNRYRWTERITAATMSRLMKRHKLGRPRAVKVLDRGVSGRARAVKVTGSKGEVVIRRELTIRRAFGDLRSSMFVVRTEGSAKSPDAFVFVGGGWGHGVGMCQTGAIGQAEKGRTYQQILKHYYPGSVLKSLY